MGVRHTNVVRAGREALIGVAAADGAVVPREVQPESRRAVAWEEFLRGARLQPGARFETP